jgi:hypothetical protein
MSASPYTLNFDAGSPRIALAERRLRAAYHRQDGEAVPVVAPTVDAPVLTTREMIEDMDKMLAQTARWANHLAATDNDWSPVLLTYCTVAMVPEAFGCKVTYLPGESPWAGHALGDISGVWSLRPLPFSESPMIRRQFEWIEYVQRKLGTAVPMWTPDIQSPFSVAAQIVEPTELMMACVTKPKAVHHLLRMVTDYLIDLTQAWLRQIEHPGFPGANFPCISENIGLCLADDTPLIMLSPAMYQEFALPYNCRIGEAFGGVHLHSCGDYRHNLDNVLQITNIRSIQVHAGPGEFPLPLAADEACPFNRARNKITCFVDANDVTRGDIYREKYQEHYTDYVLPRLCQGPLTGIILQSCGYAIEAGLDEVNQALRWTRRQLQSLGADPPA